MRRSIQWAIAVVLAGVLVAPAVADEGRGEQGGSPTTPPLADPEPKPDDDSEGRGGPYGDGCPVTPDLPLPADPNEPVLFTNYWLYCVVPPMTGGGYSTTADTWDLGEPLVFRTTYNGEAPPHMCICENSDDVLYNLLDIPGDRIAKIRKFANPIAPLGGTVTVYLNGGVRSFDTWSDMGVDPAPTLNSMMLTTLQRLGGVVSQTSKYFVVRRIGAQTPITRVGVNTTDAGLIRTEISLEPSEGTTFVDELECATGLDPSETLCGN